MGMPIDFLNKVLYSKIIKRKNGKKLLLIISFVLSLLSIFAYIFIFLHSLNNIQNTKIKFLVYALVFVINLFLKETLIIALRVFYSISLGIGFSNIVLRNMKEMSIILASLIFLGYYTALLYVKENDKIFDLIVYYVAYYFLPIFFLSILFINTINIL